MSGSPCIAVTGANGFVGRRLVEALLKHAEPVRLRVLCRSEPHADLAARRVQIVRGDLRDSAAAARLLDGADAAVNLAWRIDAPREENLQAIRSLAQAAVRASIERLVHVSTAVVAGRSAVGVVSEYTPCEPGNEYEAAKLAAEYLLRERTAGRVDLAILRPTAVFGPGGRNLLKLADDLTSGNPFVKYLKSCVYNRRRMNAVCVDNVVAAIEFLLDHPQPVNGGAFIVSDDEDQENNYRDLERSLMQRFGVRDYRIPRVPLPGFLLAGLLRMRGRSSDPRCRFDDTKLRAAGYQKRIGMDDALDEFARWYRSAA